LQLYQSTISRRIINLESTLGVKLINRTANHFELTKHGQKLFELLKEDEITIQNKIHKALNEEDIVIGEVKIMLPHTIPLNIITPKLPRFIDKYPKLKLRIYYKNDDVNLHKNAIDLAVIYGFPEQQSQKIKLVHKAEAIAFSTPEYIIKYGMINNLENLANHKILTVLRDHGEIVNRINLINKLTGKVESVKVDSRLSINSFYNALKLVDTGEYVGVAYTSVIHDEISSGKYLNILDSNYSFESANFYLIKRVEDDYKINIVADFIEDCFKEYNQRS
jgi:DNA-binding transcriptional LysR family regulator